MTQEIRALKDALDISDAQLLLLAREASQDAGLRSIDFLTKIAGEALVDHLRFILLGSRQRLIAA